MTDLARPDLPPFLTQRELAARWRITIRTLERWRAEGYGPSWFAIGGNVRFRREDVLAFERSHRRGG